MSPEEDRRAHQSPFATLAIGALGVAYGDIGTSPLYAFRESFQAEGFAVTPANVLGLLSLVFWTVTIIVTLKYMLVVLHADNRGEGGILALMALIVHRRDPGFRRRGQAFAFMGIFGASLLYGDGMITPAISVLSAIEGLHVVTPAVEPYVVPAACALLVALFYIQRGGTARIGAVFGPVMATWFSVLAFLGGVSIARNPAVLAAVNPVHALDFVTHHGARGFLVLGIVFLAVTGAEALYADMGHFGRRPIQAVWFGLVMPALLLNYFGQGALLLSDPLALRNPFYLLAPAWALIPLVLLATAATIIASQSMITGVFSLTWQAVQLGFLPRMSIFHTSWRERGQIYVPFVNWTLLIGIIILILEFRTSTNLAHAYGVAVATTMAITTALTAFVALHLWKWSAPAVAAVFGFFGVVDLAFFGSALTKFVQGGWFPLTVGGAMMLLMTTWAKGRSILWRRLYSQSMPYPAFRGWLASRAPLRVPGTAVFMTGTRHAMPVALLTNVRFNGVIHERNILVTVTIADAPRIPRAERVRIEILGDGFYRISATYGFMQRPNVPAALKACADRGLEIDLFNTSFYLGSETLLPTEEIQEMWIWRERLFALMSRNAQKATVFFRIPPEKVIEIGVQVKI